MKITLAILYTLGFAFAMGGTITVDLIHRDSIASPFYDHSASILQRMGHTLQRSFINSKRLRIDHESTYQADIIPDHGEFLMNISFGNPSHKVLVIADTGSDLSWIQCKPCDKYCYNHTGSRFDPKHSSTYQPVHCKSKTCRAIESADTNCSATKSCHFYETYADGTASGGTVSTETITLGDHVLPNIVFGCSFYSSADGFRPMWGGIIGLGGGDYSLVSQICSFVPAKFSYCLIPFPLINGLSKKSSKMIFGDFEFGPKVVSTPLVALPRLTKTYYFVTLEGISVGNRRLNFSDGLNSSKPLSKGNIIIDSGTTLTMLPPRLYDDFETAIKDAINVTTVEDPQQVMNLCYRSTANVTELMPKVMMHFEGADVELSRDNVFVTVSKHIMCFAFVSTPNVPVMGNLAQINHLVGFDLENQMVSFKPTNCEKL